MLACKAILISLMLGPHKASWLEVIETTIQSCWKKSRIWKVPEIPNWDVEDISYDYPDVETIS